MEERQTSVFCKAFPWSAVCSRILYIFLILEKNCRNKEATFPVMPFRNEFYSSFCFRTPTWSCKRYLQRLITQSCGWGSLRIGKLHTWHGDVLLPVISITSTLVHPVKIWFHFICCAHPLCFCSATKSFVIQRSLLNFIQQILSLAPLQLHGTFLKEIYKASLLDACCRWETEGHVSFVLNLLWLLAN